MSTPSKAETTANHKTQHASHGRSGALKLAAEIASFVGFAALLGWLCLWNVKQPLVLIVAGAQGGQIAPEAYMFQVQFPCAEAMYDKRDENPEDDYENNDDDEEVVGLPERQAVVFYMERYCTVDYDAEWVAANEKSVAEIEAHESVLLNGSYAMPLDPTTTSCYPYTHTDSTLPPRARLMFDAFVEDFVRTAPQDEVRAQDAAALYLAEERLTRAMRGARAMLVFYAALGCVLFFGNMVQFVLTPIYARRHRCPAADKELQQSAVGAVARGPWYVAGAAWWAAWLLLGTALPAATFVLARLGHGFAPAPAAAAAVFQLLQRAAAASGDPDVAALAGYYLRVKVVAGAAFEAALGESFAASTRILVFAPIVSSIAGYVLLSPGDEENEKDVDSKEDSEKFQV